MKLQPCRICEKPTTYRWDANGLCCARCWDAAGFDNDHEEGLHEPGTVMDCPRCYPDNFPEWREI